MPDFPDFPQFPEGSPFEDFFQDFMGKRGQGLPIQPQASLGSGFIIDAEKGYIVTNNHVIKDADDIKITLSDDETLDAELIGMDEKTDIALLQIKTDKNLTAVKFGDSDVMRVGDWVVAIGNPFGLGGTVTAGIISARQRDIHSGPYDDYIQTDASINRGNSGGPMFNLKGEVIGINTAIFSPTGGSVGIGFAIPAQLAAPVVKQIIKYGRTRRGWLGMRIQKMTDEIAESLGLDKTRGALVASVTKDSPSDVAGLKTGDVILEFNGEKIETMRSLPRLVAETDIDSKAKITFWRDNKKQTTTVKVGELEKAEENGLLSEDQQEAQKPETDMVELNSTGLSVTEMSGELREIYNIPGGVQGLVVSAITPNSTAAQKGLVEGDVIIELNQQALSSPEQAQNIIKAAKKAGRNSILLLINREGAVRFVALRLDNGEKD